MELIRLLIVRVECCPTPFQWLCEVAGYCRELELVNPEHPKHAHWVTYLVSMQAMEELGHFQIPDPCDMGPCIIMLKTSGDGGG